MAEFLFKNPDLALVTKARRNDWFNTSTLKVLHGVDALVDGLWHHISRDGKPLFFDLPCDADGFALALTEGAES